MPLDYKRVTRKWASLRRFAGCIVESALDAVRQGHIDVAQYFAKLLYFLPFSSRSLEKVLLHSLVKASLGYINKDPSYYEITIWEVPGFNPDETAKVKSAFEHMHDLKLVEAVSPDRVRLRPDIISDVVRYVAPYVADNLDLHDIDVEAISYPYRVVSGVSSLYVMSKGGRLPSSFTVLSGLISPTARVNRKGEIERKTTIPHDEWVQARINMSSLRPLRDKFNVEYFKAVGVLHENKIIVKTYPMEITGSMVDLVVAPAYYRYYKMMRERRIRRARPWRGSR